MTKELVDVVIEMNSNPAVGNKFKNSPESANKELGVNGLQIENELNANQSNSKNVKGLMLTIHS
ncbi:MAG: hypothetical protein ACPGR2_15035 [Psychrobium sp.]